MGAAEGDLIRETGIRGNLAAEIVEAESNIEESEEVLATFAAIGVQVLYPDSLETPVRLRESPTAWHCLMVWGDSGTFDQVPLVGMVGRRRATPHGLEVAHKLASELARRGIATLSGLAAGIDQASHLGSLSEGGKTIGLPAMGILRFMREEKKLAPATESGLTVVSGAPPNQHWSVKEAMRRNRLIGTWCDSLVVVEAGEKGGTWKTASCAREAERPLWVGQGLSGEVAGVGNKSLARQLEAKTFDVNDPIEVVADRILESVTETSGEKQGVFQWEGIDRG